MNFLDTNGIKYIKHDIAEANNLDNLIKLGGINQVPFLYDKDNHVKMYESNDIIEYLSK